MKTRSVIIGTGSYLPTRIMTNAELSLKIDTTDDWIRQRTGIQQRHIAADGQLTSDLGYEAAVGALKNAGLESKDIDLLIVATTTPDLTFPSTANKIQQRLGGGPYPSFDVQAACTGFIYALSIADAFLKSSSQYKRALVVGAETFTRMIDWEDRSTCVLFGDGAGAVVLEKQETESRGLMENFIASDGAHFDLMHSTAGVSHKGEKGTIVMNGRDVFRLALQKLPDAMEKVLALNHLEAQDIDWFIPHQANKRIIDAMAEHIKLPTEKIIYTVHKHANTSAASIPLALDDANRQGLLKPGQLILMDALGAGFTWGACLVRW